MSEGSTPRIELRSAQLSAEIDPLGAQLSALRDGAGHNWLWHGDPGVWAGRAPILFPIVGMLAGGQYRLGGHAYALSRHGFARGKAFEVVTATATAATFRLCADASTLAVYPFQFTLDVAFEINASSLAITASIRNEGTTEMPASLGFHPGFLWPLPFGQPRAAHFIQFEADEPAAVRRITAEGLLSPEKHPTPIVQRRLLLTDDLFRDDVLILDQVRSGAVRYGAAQGPQLEIAWPDARYLGIWTKPGAPFVCIEPWWGITDPVGFAGDFHDKPGIFGVAPGAARSLAMTLTLRDPPSAA